MFAFLEAPETWVAVAFLIFVGFAAKPAMKAIGSALDARAARIKAELDEARNLREEAQHMLADYQRKLRDAVKETEMLLAHAREEAELQRTEAMANFEVTMARREKMALEKIAQAELQAVAEVRNQAVDLAMAAATRLLQENIDAARGAALIDGAIAELDKKLH